MKKYVGRKDVYVSNMHMGQIEQQGITLFETCFWQKKRVLLLLNFFLGFDFQQIKSCLSFFP